MITIYVTLHMNNWHMAGLTYIYIIVLVITITWWSLPSLDVYHVCCVCIVIHDSGIWRQISPTQLYLDCFVLDLFYYKAEINYINNEHYA